jgi:hypothetical protein
MSTITRLPLRRFVEDKSILDMVGEVHDCDYISSDLLEDFVREYTTHDIINSWIERGNGLLLTSTGEP